MGGDRYILERQRRRIELGGGWRGRVGRECDLGMRWGWVCLGVSVWRWKGIIKSAGRQREGFFWGSVLGGGFVREVLGWQGLWRMSGVEGSSEGGEVLESRRGVGFMINLQWFGVIFFCVFRSWLKRNQENYLMRSCRGREWGYGVRSFGGGGGEVWRLEQRKEEYGRESEQNLEIVRGKGIGGRF